MNRHVFASLTVAAALSLAGCSRGIVREDAAASVQEEQVQAEGRLKIPAETISLISLEYEGVITDMKGAALLINRKSTGYNSLGIGDKIPFDRILNTKPKTIIELTLPTGEKVFIYSQEKESWFRIEEAGK